MSAGIKVTLTSREEVQVKKQTGIRVSKTLRYMVQDMLIPHRSNGRDALTWSIGRKESDLTTLLAREAKKNPAAKTSWINTMGGLVGHHFMVRNKAGTAN